MKACPGDASTRLNHPRPEDTAPCGWALARQWMLGVSLAIACQSALAQAMYRIKPLNHVSDCISTFIDVSGLNRDDEVIGTGCNANGDFHALLWMNYGAQMVDLGPDQAGATSTAFALNASGLVTGRGEDSKGAFSFVSSGDGTPMKKIPNGIGGSEVDANALNDLGQVTGGAYTADGSFHAFLWRNDGSPMRDLGRLGGGAINSFGNAINASGDVAGESDPPGGSDGREHDAVVWKYGMPILDLGTLGGFWSRALFINASGQVAGESATRNFSRVHGFLWRNDGTPIGDLGTLGGAETFVFGFNDSGQITGTSDTLRWLKPHAFVWMNDGKPMKNLGTLGGTRSQGNDINASGQVAGDASLPGDTITHAFLWRNDGTKIQDLNTLIDPLDPLKPYVTLTSGKFINDDGDIVAYGTDSRTGLSNAYALQATVLTLSPRSLAFGNRPIHTTSATKSLTLTNTSPKVVTISSIALAGSGRGQFAATNNCGKSLVGLAACTIKVTFTPTTKGAKSAFLNVNGGGDGLRTVTLTGTGT
jgi:probable HAF family extracellular repeat protein